MKRPRVVDIDLPEHLYEQLKNWMPLPSIVQSEFVAGNQVDVADYVLAGAMRFRHVQVDVTEMPSISGKTQGVTDAPQNLLSLSSKRSECRAQCLSHRGDGRRDFRRLVSHHNACTWSALRVASSPALHGSRAYRGGSRAHLRHPCRGDVCWPDTRWCAVPVWRRPAGLVHRRPFRSGCSDTVFFENI